MYIYLAPCINTALLLSESFLIKSQLVEVISYINYCREKEGKGK